MITSVFALNACTKLIEVAPPTAQILESESYKDSLTIQQNLAGMYAMFLGKTTYQAGASTYPGMSADELLYLGSNYNAYINNGLTIDDGNVAQIWNSSYSIIYLTNSVILNMANTSFSESFKNSATGEALFLRALCHFYLVNYFGDVPLVTTTDVSSNAKSPRTPAAAVYDQIIADLKQAAIYLPGTYAQTGGARTRATSWAANALLARVYLYRQQWQEAANTASKLIDNTAMFSLPTDLATVFTPGSTEAIFQFYNDATGFTSYASTVIPNPVSRFPTFYLRPQLLNAFETGDARRNAWTASVTYNGTDYTYPNKYKSLAGGANAEYYTVLRLAEQYLIKAEALAQLNDLSAAKDALNAVRLRAGLRETSAGTQAEILAAVAQENRIEFNCEWGHRWFDLKRTNTADAVLSTIKPTWKSTAVLYPIPSGQIQLNNNLKQNQGY